MDIAASRHVRGRTLTECMVRIAGAILTMAIMITFSSARGEITEIRAGEVGENAYDRKVLEGIEWHLREVGGLPVSSLHGERRPSLMFDEAKKQASGFNGCNNFFANYEIDGFSLKFGPVAATRRVCEGTAGEVEMRFMQALDKTRAWEINGGLLILLGRTGILARFSTVDDDVVDIDPESMTFLSRWFPSGKATLSHGEYHEPAAPGSASEIVVRLTDKRAFGMINGGQKGAVVLVTDAGGSGTFYDLALLSREAKRWVNTDTILLGDRVRIQAIEVTNDRIMISMITHGPDDPMCCPTLKVTNKFAVRNNKLVPVMDESPKKEIPEIIGKVWKWDQTVYNNDTMTVPAESDHYTIILHPDGKVDVRADCNRGGGTYAREGSSISIDITHTTRAMCPPDSREGEFLRNLSAAVIYFVKDDNLYLDLRADTGTMRFSR